jgi:hypothetical protein
MANEDKVHIGHVHFVPDTNPGIVNLSRIGLIFYLGPVT